MLTHCGWVYVTKTEKARFWRIYLFSDKSSSRLQELIQSSLQEKILDGHF